MKKIYKFILFAFILIILKQLLIMNIPIYAIGNSDCDDLLMVNLETSILQFDWLGAFNSLTFVKGMFFPLFLGMSYINGVTLFYSISCLIFVLAIKDLFKKKWSIYVIFSFLIFNPIMFSVDVIGRVYRNSLTPGQVLLIFASVIAIFINRKKDNKKSLWMWSILCGLTLSSFWNTREDAIWILPMVIVFMLIMVFEHITINKRKFQTKKIIQFILPLIILFTCNFGISAINYIKYGVFARVDVSSSSFADAIKAIYSVPVEENIEYVTVTREKLERLYKISPSLNSISAAINEISLEIDSNGRNPGDGEIEDGWFWWVLRFAAEENGYYENALKADKFFSNITKEIKDAQDKKLIGKQSTMPSALMSPWRKGYSKELLNTALKIINYTNKYDDVNAATIESVGSYNSIKLFEIATNDKAIMPSIYSKITGWYIYNLNDYYINSVNTTNNQITNRIECRKEHPCVIKFDFSDIEDISVIALEVYDVDNINIEKLHLKDNITSDINEMRSYNINEYSLKNATHYQKKVADVYINRLNLIGKIYKITGPLFGILGLLSYLFITFVALFKKHKMIEKWLLLSSVLASYLILCLGVAYNEISSCASINPMYLSGSYPLIIVFTTMSTLMSFEYLIAKEKTEVK